MGPENDLVLRDSQNWASRSHRELYDSVHHNNDPGQAGELGSEWAQFGAELTESAQLIAKRVAASESGWTGEAAEGARAAIRGLAEWITLTARTAVEVGNRVATQGRIMETARANMPEPPAFNLDSAVRGQADPGLAGFTASAADLQAESEKARAAHEQAVAVMETMEKQSHEIDATTPVFTAPYNPVTGKSEEPPQPMMLRSSGAPSLSGASAPPPVGLQSVPGTSSPVPSPGGAPVAPAAYSGPPGIDAPVQSPQGPSYQPAAYQPPADGTAVAAASGYQPQSGGYGATGVSGYQAPAEHRPQQYGAPVPYSAQQNAPRTGDPRHVSRTTGSTDPRNPSRTADPRNLPRTAGTATTGGPNPADPRSAVRPPAGPDGAGRFGGGGTGGAGGFGGTGAARGGFPPGQFAAGGSGGPQMQPGGAAGVTSPSRGPVPAGGVGLGAAAAAGMSPAGGPMGGPATGKGEEDKEHRAASYLIGGDLFEVPGENLPPSVIGAAKPKKKQPPAPEPTT
ncbi:PPE-repeat protein [Lentzea atacamensis]|uniref:PPE-repeat protein n=1 Tax=Lentzea atacamensis TaxID=531938 RepID=A0ABX9EH26_9PSEU|nr:PPE domain-containing protein [Lentzea atacamensis]RAS70484.1 PPE-repeat protein [Lentzea atacamensis]